MKTLRHLVAFILLTATSAWAGITGGALLKAPWVVQINYQGRVHCSGTLIAPDAILTAAHCFYGLSLDTALISLRGGGDGSSDSLRSLPVIASISLHPHYRGVRTIARDIALIKLTAPVVMGPDLYAIPVRDISALRLSTLNVFIAGWGATSPTGAMSDRLRGFSTPIFRAVDVVPGSVGGDIISRYFKGPSILAFLANSAATCGGDSGTGWVISLPGEGPHLIGVHSQGDCQTFGLAAELSGALPWLERELSGL